MTKYEIRHGDYVLFCESTGKILSSTSEVSVLFSVDDHAVILQKHGNPEWVQNYMNEAVQKLRNAGFDEMADSFKMYTGQFPVEALNRLLSTTGYATKFVRQIESGAMLPRNMDIAL